MALLIGGLLTGNAGAADFYQGKTIRFIVGFSAGGGYDAYTRLVAKYITRYIPGKPSTVVENMTGAGSVIAANYIYNKAKADGTVVGVWDAHNIFNNMMGDRSVRIDGRKFSFIGSPGSDSAACAIMGHTGPKTFEEITKSKKKIRMGATRGGNTVQLPEMMNRWAGGNFEIIKGYTGTSTIRLAMRSKEVDGGCWTWDSMRSTARSMVDAKGDAKMIPFIINGQWEDPEVKDIAQFKKVITDQDNLHAFTVWNRGNEFSRPFSLPPGAPAESVDILSKAFKATMADADYKADADRAKLGVEYISPEKIKEYIEEIYATPPEVRKRLEFTVPKRK